MESNNNNNISIQLNEPYTPTGDPSLWYLNNGRLSSQPVQAQPKQAAEPQPGQIGAVPPSLFNAGDLEEGSIVGYELDEHQQQQEQAPLAPPLPLPLPQQQQAPPPAPLPLTEQTATRENCLSVLANGEKTTFMLSFGMQFNKRVQEFGPLSMSGCLTLEAKGEIKESLQEEIETALNRTLQDLGYRFKLCYGPVCAEILSPEEAVVKEKVRRHVEKKSEQAATATTTTKKKAAEEEKKKKKTTAAVQKGENAHHPSSSPSSMVKKTPPPPPKPTAATPTTTTTSTAAEKEGKKVPMANGKKEDGHFQPPPLPRPRTTAPPPPLAPSQRAPPAAATARTPPPPQKPAVAHKTKRVTAAARSKQISSFQKEIDRALGVSLVLGGPKGAIEPHERGEIESFIRQRVDNPTERNEIVQAIIANEERRARGKEDAKKEEKEKSATPPAAKRAKPCSPTSTTTNTNTNVNWCKIGDKVYTREETEERIKKAIRNGFGYFAELLREGLCDESEAPSLLIGHVKIAWNTLPDSKKTVVFQQALSSTYGREWSVNDKGRTEFDTWLCLNIHQFFLDQISG